ncbi:MAG: AraC family transcriptional regulator [Proteobacteria bacterium]|nr:AraC family transcriptional regulator [Pseudomonadota bacterium]
MQSVAVNVYDARACELVGKGTPFSARASYFPFATSSISYCNYGAPTRIAFRDDDYLRVQFGIAGTARTTIGRVAYDLDSETLITSPPDAALEFSAGYEQLVLRVDRLALEQDVTALLGRRQKGGFEFEISTAVNASAHSRRLREQVFHTVRMIDLANDSIPRPLLVEMEQVLRLAVLFGIPNRLSVPLVGGEKAAAPWQVRAVEEWIDTHWRESVTLEKLVEVSGASARSIFITFRNARGYTPMTYLKKVRLKAARTQLLRPTPEATVTGVMFACGFTSQGHFARDYRQEFGELPSETLRKARGAQD